MQLLGACVRQLWQALREVTESFIPVTAGFPRNQLDYVCVFIGAGKNAQEAAYTFESVYTRPDRVLMQGARDRVLILKRSADSALAGCAHCGAVTGTIGAPLEQRSIDLFEKRQSCGLG